MWLLVLLALSVLFIVGMTARFKVHPLLVLIVTAVAYGLLGGMSPGAVIAAVNAGFGGTIGNIGLVILFGAIIGVFLEKSGGAMRIAESALALTGPRHTPLAMTLVGYVVSIPVFCDSAFVLLSPVNKALARRAKSTLAAGAIALSLGLYATHTMIPPTPGPVGAAGVLGADLGLVILWGVIVAMVAALAGWGFAALVAARVNIAPDGDAPDANAMAIPESASEPPTTPKALLPILLPLLLILARSIAELPAKPLGAGEAAVIIGFLGQPVVALMIGALTAFLLPKRFDWGLLSVSGWVGQAVAAAAPIIVITGAGGAFGKVLQESGIADVIGSGLTGYEGIGVWLPLFIAAGIKTAQGSSTVAMITTAGLVAPLLPALGLDSPAATALCVVAIGAGGMMVSHANDSYFWVVTQFSNMSMGQGYRLQTLGTFVQGVAAALAIAVIAAMIL
ncbi:MAG TPA: GntP family permease [Candidatus Hydrogenedentes bacterium]|nr:GntP family permease [Candidatus Hydrogenedentota bacterium]